MNNRILLAILALVALLTGLGLNQFAQASPSSSLSTNIPQWTIEAITVDFDAVDMVSETDGWAAADFRLYRYDGSRWEVAQQLDIGEKVADIHMLSTTSGWAVGSRFEANKNGSEEQGAIWHFDGNQWQSFPSPTDIALNKIHMTSATSGWAVGANRYFGGQGVVIRYNGVAWEVVSSDFSGDDIDVISDNDVWVVGGDGIYHYDGNIWQQASDHRNMNAVSMLSATEGWAVGYDSQSSSNIMRYDGTSWSEVASPTDKSLQDVIMLSSSDGWAVGSRYNSETFSYESVILRYDGTSWQSVQNVANTQLRTISMRSATSGWMVGFNGSILQYEGSSWQTRSDLLTPSGLASSVSAVQMLSATDGWAVGGGVLRYDGNSWQPVSHPASGGLYDLDMLTPTDGWAVGRDDILHYDGNSWQSVSNPTAITLHAVDMLSATDGWAVGGQYNTQTSSDESVILHYDGTSWQSVSSPADNTLYDLEMLSPTEGWAVGSGGIILRYDGTSWQSVETTGRSLLAVEMLSATDGWAVSWDGTILHYDGTTWQSVETPTSEDLEDIVMLSATSGWAVGDNGTILYYDGNTWQQVTSPTDRDLYGIHMLDSQTGRIVGDEVILSLGKAAGESYSVSGRVTDSSGSPIENVTLSAGAASATTDSNGQYTIPDLAPGEYTLTPEKAGYTFDPESRSVSIQNADVTEQDFVGMLQQSLTTNYPVGAPGSFFTITGSDFAANSSVSIAINGRNLGTVQTNESGQLSFLLTTSNADLGGYSVSATAQARLAAEITAGTSFMLDSTAPLRPQEGQGEMLDVPAGMAHTQWLYLPIVIR